VSTELFPSNGCYAVACLHSCYLAMGLHVTILFMSEEAKNRRLLLPVYSSLQPRKMSVNAQRHEDVWGSGCIDPRFLDLGSSWR
jgi:hypothetical protein